MHSITFTTHGDAIQQIVSAGKTLIPSVFILLKKYQEMQKFVLCYTDIFEFYTIYTTYLQNSFPTYFNIEVETQWNTDKLVAYLLE